MTAAQMTDTHAIHTFLFGHTHRAVFTLVSPRTGNRFTYRVQRKAGIKDPFFFVSLLSGPENENDYQFIGTVAPRPVTNPHMAPSLGTYEDFRHGRKSLIDENAPSVAAIDFLVRRIRFASPLDPEKLQFWHSGRCSNCGRLLTDPESIAVGMGPKCRQRTTVHG